MKSSPGRIGLVLERFLFLKSATRGVYIWRPAPLNQANLCAIYSRVSCLILINFEFL
jgi:hypothetical protein